MSATGGLRSDCLIASGHGFLNNLGVAHRSAHCVYYLHRSSGRLTSEAASDLAMCSVDPADSFRVYRPTFGRVIRRLGYDPFRGHCLGGDGNGIRGAFGKIGHRCDPSF